MRLKPWTVNLSHRRPFSQTSGGGCVATVWGIVHPFHCATLRRTLTDKWPDGINSLSCWFWGMWGTAGASTTAHCTAGDFRDTENTWLWHESAPENNFTWSFWTCIPYGNKLMSYWSTLRHLCNFRPSDCNFSSLTYFSICRSFIFVISHNIYIYL